MEKHEDIVASKDDPRRIPFQNGVPEEFGQPLLEILVRGGGIVSGHGPGENDDGIGHVGDDDQPAMGYGFEIGGKGLELGCEISPVMGRRIDGQHGRNGPVETAVARRAVVVIGPEFRAENKDTEGVHKGPVRSLRNGRKVFRIRSIRFP
jgi:hypothetical protein